MAEEEQELNSVLLIIGRKVYRLGVSVGSQCNISLAGNEYVNNEREGSLLEFMLSMLIGIDFLRSWCSS